MAKPTDLVQGTLYYLLTRSGRQQLEKELSAWKRLSTAIDLVVQDT